MEKNKKIDDLEGSYYVAIMHSRFPGLLTPAAAT